MTKTEIQEPKRNSVDSISLIDYILEQSSIKNIYRKTHKKIKKTHFIFLHSIKNHCIFMKMLNLCFK